jgi:hypothetical protein
LRRNREIKANTPVSHLCRLRSHIN